eukprot:Blabericola_migrator_1__2306@NODE_1640_length_4114_cov_138_288115_g1068_i0_p2_GENE_NODE_1640_length_4114_cov_138_288115_g1068_i0NODE_1640_length_4114_cov_138_288115_g1068_i0_p2_ORF_typecomplete_len375_score45_17UAA/PF08449_11/1_5e67TPT/PF03151_16/4_8e03TPT/PF03151_16/2_8e19EamA/PF00892_20/73EamA/PF00892_20/0_0001EamA/PF00892_20/6_8e08Nuc_sug_transp/PF04142_15/20Nuc_sug_transp/PF04142_15/9_4e08SLC35F/PF06027_12/8_3e08PUNUT/PF16913_5/0_015CRTlike/PF08627_10/7_5e02CRTlike/PF08627_10/0_00019CRTlike/
MPEATLAAEISEEPAALTKTPTAKTKTHEAVPSSLNWLIILLAVIGIYGCFLTQGLAQESIYHTEIDSTGSRFRSPIFLVSLNCTCSGILGAILLFPRLQAVLRRKEKVDEKNVSNVNGALEVFAQDPVARWILLEQGFLISLTYAAAMCCTNYSLTKVNYPTQVLVKSAKAVPVVIGGWLMYGKKYPLADYVMVAAITTGLVIFQYANATKSSPSSNQSQIAGYIALAGSLLFDGMTGPRQDKLIASYHLTTGEMMLLINLFAAPIGFAASFLIEGTLPLVVLASQMGVLLPKILAFVVCGAGGQLCIVYVLRSLGSLHLTLITTTRKFFAVLLSVIWFRHSLSSTQWVAVGLIFMSAFLKYGFKNEQKRLKE